MIAQELEVSLHMAFVEARQQRHEFIMVEHLLLALLDNPTAATVLRSCGAKMEELRKNLMKHITEETPRIPADREVDTQPTLGFQRVIQRAILHIQSSGKKEVTGANVLVAMFGESKSQAVYFLQQQGITRVDVVNYVSHGITKAPAASPGSTGGDPLAGPAADDEPPIGSHADDELGISLQTAFAEALQERHEFITVEHLLLALLDNPSAAEVLKACGADLGELRKNLVAHVDEQTPRIAEGREVNTQPTLGFQRVMQRASLHVQSLGKKELTSAHLLVAMFGEKDSHAVYFLQAQGVSRLDVVTYLAHGAAPASEPSAQHQASNDVQVILFNDEYTPMEFVARVLQRFFAMSKEDAAETMLEIYRDGSAVCGLYSQQDGEMLVQKITEFARESGHPLHCATLIPK